MNDELPEKPKRLRKRFWILTFTLLASIASFALSLFGVIVSFLGVMGGIFTFVVIPTAGDYIFTKVEEQNAGADTFITMTAVLGCLFLALYLVLLFKLKK